jgi:hypothetical protein
MVKFEIRQQMKAINNSVIGSPDMLTRQPGSTAVVKAEVLGPPN